MDRTAVDLPATSRNMLLADQPSTSLNNRWIASGIKGSRKLRQENSHRIFTLVNIVVIKFSWENKNVVFRSLFSLEVKKFKKKQKGCGIINGRSR
jgi:hypothetical protein